MPTNDSTIWELKPHSKAKHEILKKYLQAWFPIIGKYNPEVTFIDGYCGPGRYKEGEAGSPIIALQVGKEQRRFLKKVNLWFVEEDEERYQQLTEELDRVGVPENFFVKPILGKFFKEFYNESLQDDLKKSPSFALIDPFGFADLPFALIENTLSYPNNEVMVTFMVDAINRWLTHPDPQIQNHVVNYFGTDESLEVATKFQRVLELRELYQRQLKRVAKYVRYFEMRDFKNRLIYFLFFATNNRLGFIRMKEAMWSVDPSGEFRFSDATNPDQLILLEVDPLPKLVDEVQKKFKGVREIACRQIRDYVEDQTLYLKKHLTEALRILEEEGQIKVDEIKMDGKKRRSRTFPDNARIKFL